VKNRQSLPSLSQFTVLSVFLGLFVACKPAPVTSEATSQSAGGFAQHVFYRCAVKTVENGQSVVRQTSAFNNTTQELSLQSDFAGQPTLQFSELKKSSTDFWNSPGRVSLRLALKRDGSKGVILGFAQGKPATSIEDSVCEELCTGPTVKADNRCLWSGLSGESVIGNMIIETVATAGLGTIWRAATLARAAQGASKVAITAKGGQGLLALDPAFRSGAQAIAKSSSFDDALSSLSKSLQKTNPLSGTSALGPGNCANDAMTQLVSLVLGRWACAIPYPKGALKYASQMSIVDDLTRLVGVKSKHLNITDLSGFAAQNLAKNMADGDVAFLFSTAKGAGHATLITKLKGRLVHINNQNWPVKFQPVEHWEQTWLRTFAKEGARYHVYLSSKKLIGF
jgi:hypothetical protein